MRFNLQFNLNDEDQKLAASLLNGMGRKKTALVTKAILFLFENHPEGIHDLKKYDYTKTSDLMFRASLNVGTKTNKDKTLKPKQLPVKKIDVVENDKKNKQTQDIPTQLKNNENNESHIIPKENIQDNTNNEDNEILEGMLDALDSFM